MKKSKSHKGNPSPVKQAPPTTVSRTAAGESPASTGGGSGKGGRKAR
jgi:hypothetical protein